MRRRSWLIPGCVVVIVMIFLPAFVSAEVPQTINYQGYLTDSAGVPVNGTVSLTLKLYDSEAGPITVLWSETHPSVSVTNGVYSVILGSIDPIGNPLLLPFDAQYWLGITVGTDYEMSPRQALAVSPYAFRAVTADTATNATNAANAATLGGQLPSAFATSGHSHGSLSNLSIIGTLTLPAVDAQIKAGTDTIISTHGSYNFFSGTNAGNLSTTGQWNTATGDYALRWNTTGNNNVAFGPWALGGNTTGSGNTAVGAGAGSGGSASSNVAVGSETLGQNTYANNNVAIGAQALYNHGMDMGPLDTVETNTTAVGYRALANNSPSGTTAGMNNTALGANAGVTADDLNANVWGSRNTFIGANSGPGTSTQIDNATAIGYGALVSQSNSLVLGNGSVKVGIGTQTPTQALDVVGTVKADGFSGNGAGLSNVNALTLENQSAASFAAASHTHTGGQITSEVANAANAGMIAGYQAGNVSGNVPVSNGTLNANLNADMLDGKHASDFVDIASTQSISGAKTFDGGINVAANGLTVGTNQLVTAGGKVGIGTASPAKMLQVAGDFRVQPGQYMYTATGAAAVPGILTPQCACDLNSYSAECPARNYSNSDLGLNCYDVWDNGYEDYDLGWVTVFYSNPFVRIAAAPLLETGAFGGIGINTSTPYYDLDVNGTVRVNGGMTVVGPSSTGPAQLVRGGNPANTAFVVQGASNQTANLQEWQANSNGGVVASVSRTGVFTGNGSGLSNVTASNLNINCAEGQILKKVSGTWQCSAPCEIGDMVSCYTGPAGTLGVGICSAGTRTCGSAGWGACVGQVAPTPEICNSLLAGMTWYRDADSDGYGDPNIQICSCAGSAGYVSSGSDCNDQNSEIRPGADFHTVPIPGSAPSNWDYDCDGQITKQYPTGHTPGIGALCVGWASGTVAACGETADYAPYCNCDAWGCSIDADTVEPRTQGCK